LGELRVNISRNFTTKTIPHGGTEERINMDGQDEQDVGKTRRRRTGIRRGGAVTKQKHEDTKYTKNLKKKRAGGGAIRFLGDICAGGGVFLAGSA
jgi:hypothetical protein